MSFSPHVGKNNAYVTTHGGGTPLVIVSGGLSLALGANAFGADRMSEHLVVNGNFADFKDTISESLLVHT